MMEEYGRTATLGDDVAYQTPMCIPLQALGRHQQAPTCNAEHRSAMHKQARQHPLAWCAVRAGKQALHNSYVHILNSISNVANALYGTTSNDAEMVQAKRL